MRIALAIILAAFVFHAHAAVPKIVNNFATTNPPSTLSNIVQSLAGSPYASNVTSGGVLPQGTVSASTATAGYVLATDGTLRQWTNRVSLANIDGIGGAGNTNLVTGGIISTNANVANTRLILNGAQNGATGNVVDYTTNGVSKISATTDGDLTIAGTNRVVKLRVGGAAESANAVGVTGSISASANITASGSIIGSINNSSAYRGTTTASDVTLGSTTANNIIGLSTNFTLSGQLLATNGIASYSSISVVPIAATGWTNIWSTNNAVVVFDGTTCFYTNYLRSGVAYYTNVAALGHERMSLQPGEGVAINGTGVTGIAKPF